MTNTIQYVREYFGLQGSYNEIYSPRVFLVPPLSALHGFFMQESPGRALKLFWAHLAGLQIELKYFWPIHCLSPPPMIHAFWLLVCF